MIMANQSLNKFVKNQNDRGFTLVEMLFAFSIFSMIVILLPLMVQLLIQDQPLEKRIQHFEWEVFISQMKKELRMSQKITVVNQRIQLEKDGQIIIYEKYGTTLRRRVDGKGHEIILQQVAAFQFTRLPNGVFVSVEDYFGNKYQEEIRVLLRDVVL
ncbi:competence type IV pilus minor pilin ComGF [Bacillus sp. T3]|uniref:competence type IV pilus minor pilin ComGF n=1 Tax=Bacillus sp. T3 TaxID=467262 RepID=UPI002980DBAD|nr:competence type IV pilus minor pilin ComGF [Bacillus sp. T3]